MARKEYYRKRASVIVFYLANILVVTGILLLIPFIIGILYNDPENYQTSILTLFKAFIIPGFSVSILGTVLRKFSTPHEMKLKDSMFICFFAWILASLTGAVPFSVILGSAYLDSVFETMSGLTTTGITLFRGLDEMPRSILFWRAMTQWIGGLGILSMFVLIGFKGGAAVNKLFLAEGHKISAKKPTPGIVNTARVLWTLYITFTVVQIILLKVLGLDFFDAVTHSFTSIATGGYSIHDASIAYYGMNGYKHYHLIELVFLLFMLFGGMNFFIHYRLWRGKIKALWDNSEMRYFWTIIFGGVLLILLSKLIQSDFIYREYNGEFKYGPIAILLHTKDIFFQMISIMTTTGYATRDINSPYFTAVAKQIFLLLMIIGGCAGSTSGGIKVVRVTILSKLVGNRLFKINTSQYTRAPLIIDNEKVGDEEVKRVVVIVFIWVMILAFGGILTSMLSDLTGWQSFSASASALGNIGPCYITVEQMAGLHPVIKIFYILSMLAGRLEILPVMILFNKRFFK